MILASGGFVVLALGLLVSGLAGRSLGLVYGSIAATVAAFALLIVAIRRDRDTPAGHEPQAAPPPAPPP